ncbi:MAG: ComF family protein [Kiritimatiellales bacterium]|nr:ComF family protein [Kiritimatiellales bacterium]
MKRLLDIIYPRQCVGCGTSSPDTFRYICWDCWSQALPINAPFCSICGDPVAGSIDHGFTCYTCAAERPAFDRARSTVRYDGAIGEALRMLKYENALWLAYDLAGLLHTCVVAEYSTRVFDLIVPVPLYHVRRRQRGYNQSEQLARALGRRMRCACIPGMLKRTRPTATQTNLTAKARLSNVHDAFHHRREKWLAGRRVLLVDDVMTTGATVNACARALKQGGADSVHVITVARG